MFIKTFNVSWILGRPHSIITKWVGRRCNMLLVASPASDLDPPWGIAHFRLASRVWTRGRAGHCIALPKQGTVDFLVSTGTLGLHGHIDSCVGEPLDLWHGCGRVRGGAPYRWHERSRCALKILPAICLASWAALSALARFLHGNVRSLHVAGRYHCSSGPLGWEFCAGEAGETLHLGSTWCKPRARANWNGTIGADRWPRARMNCWPKTCFARVDGMVTLEQGGLLEILELEEWWHVFKTVLLLIDIDTDPAILIDGSLEVKLPTICRDGKAVKKWEDQTRERVGSKKMQVREKVGKSRFTVFFQWFGAPEGRKVTSLTGAEPAGQMRDEKLHAVVARSTFPSHTCQKPTVSDHFWKLRRRKSARRCGAKRISKSKVSKTHGLRPLLEVEMSKKCTPLWREAHFQVKMYKAHHSRTTFGSWDVERVHAVVARSTLPSQNVQSTPFSDHFWKLRCWKSGRRCGAKHISKSKCTKHDRLGPLLEVEMLKEWTSLWREAHFQVKMYKARQARTTFWRSDVGKVHAVVARSTFPSQNVQSTTGSDHFLTFRCRESARRCGAKHISKSNM